MDTMSLIRIFVYVTWALLMGSGVWFLIIAKRDRKRAAERLREGDEHMEKSSHILDLVEKVYSELRERLGETHANRDELLSLIERVEKAQAEARSHLERIRAQRRAGGRPKKTSLTEEERKKATSYLKAVEKGTPKEIAADTLGHASETLDSWARLLRSENPE